MPGYSRLARWDESVPMEAPSALLAECCAHTFHKRLVVWAFGYIVEKENRSKLFVACFLVWVGGCFCFVLFLMLMACVGYCLIGGRFFLL